MSKSLLLVTASAVALSLRAAPPTAELPEYVVQGAQPSLAGTAPILGGSLIGTPVATTVIPQGLIRDQHQITLTDALQNSAGVVGSSGNGVHDFFVVRGIDSLTGSMVLFDGVPEPEASFYPLYNIREVHVLKGPGAFFFGGNSLAGSVNLVREQPSANAKPGGSLSLEAGSFSTFGQELDLQAPNLRLNQFYRQSDGYRDGMEYERYGVNPSVSWGGQNQRATLQLEYAKSEATPDAGIPTLGDRLFPAGRKDSFQDDDEFSDQEIFRGVFGYERSLGAGSLLRGKLYATRLDWESTGSVFAGFIPFAMGLEPQPATLARYKPALDDEQNLMGAEAEWLRDLQAGRLKHHLLGGVEVARYTDEYTLTTNPGQSLHLPTGARLPGFLPPLPVQQGDATSDMVSVYGADRVEFGSALSVVLGARADWLDFEDDAQGTSRDDNEISPFVGITVPVTAQVSFFADAGEGFAPPSTLTSGPRRAPEESRQIEGGLKFASADRAWNGQLAVFQIERENIAIPDATGLLRQNGDQTSTGAELELSGRLHSGTTISAQYAWLDSELDRYSEYQGPRAVAYDGATAPFAPEHLARLWLRQDLGGGFGLGAGVRFTGEQFIHADNRLELDATTVVDAALYYEEKTWDVAVHFENLTDETVYGRGVSSTSVRPEDGFGVFGALRVRWE